MRGPAHHSVRAGQEEAKGTSTGESSGGQRWSGRSWGGTWLFNVCVTLLPYVGSRGAWLISFVIASCFCAVGGRGQFGMMAYWHRLRPHASRLVLHFLAFRHFASFGRILCDRLLVFQRPKDFRITVEGVRSLRDLRQRKQGCILLSAHIGNWELSSFWLNELTDSIGKVHVVMVRDDPVPVQRFVDERMRAGHTAVIDPHDGIGASLAINAALSSGDVVCMLGDRVLGEQPAVKVRFLNGTARFPVGPFHAAALTGMPILTGFLIKTGLRSYLVHVDAPWYIRLPKVRSERNAVLRDAVQRWAMRLELQVRRNPQQWHNFYDFWS
jgi:predicted LPLAT superfamily acyltransferase